MLLLLRFFYVFAFFFKIHVYVFLSCLVRFLELWLVLALIALLQDLEQFACVTVSSPKSEMAYKCLIQLISAQPHITVSPRT